MTSAFFIVNNAPVHERKLTYEILPLISFLRSMIEMIG